MNLSIKGHGVICGSGLPVRNEKDIMAMHINQISKEENIDIHK